MGTNASSKNQQIEFDVFPKEKRQKDSYPFDTQIDTAEETPAINVVFSNQSVIVVIICAVLLLIASFSLGVEKGKLITRSGQETIEAAQSKPTAQENSMPFKEPEPKGIIIAENTIDVKAVTEDKLLAKSDLEEIKDAAIKPGYTIQVASLKTDDSAKELSESLKKKGIPSFTKTSGEYIIVLAGNFKTREAAQLQFKQLKKTFNDCFIRKI
ncbi:MAG: SPOR domain-containing protein [Candidatus Omnitrophota bacterium]